MSRPQSYFWSSCSSFRRLHDPSARGAITSTCGFTRPRGFKLLIVSNLKPNLSAVRSLTLGSFDTSHRQAYEHRNRTKCRYNGPIAHVVRLARPCTLGTLQPSLAEFVARSPQDFRTRCKGHSERTEARRSSGN